MKQILPYLLLLAGLPALAQKNTKLKINITTDFSRRHHFKPDTIRFYKLPEDTLAFTVPPEIIRESFALKHIPIGTYRITYINMFMESTTRQITLLKKPLNEISLCVDSLDSYPQNTLARLQDKDSILLHFSSVGCDGHYTANIILTRDKDHFVGMYRFFEDTDSLFRSVILTDYQIKAFVKFENELLQIKPFITKTKLENGLIFTVERVCTTTDWYAVKSKYYNIEKRDTWCGWDGFNCLATSLFGHL